MISIERSKERESPSIPGYITTVAKSVNEKLSIDIDQNSFSSLSQYIELRQNMFSDDHFSEKERQLIDTAYVLAEYVHGKQTRDDGNPYMLHVLAVTDLLFTVSDDFVPDVQTVVGALLHDVVEDSEKNSRQFNINIVNSAHIFEVFNPPQNHAFAEQIKIIVDGCTKVRNKEKDIEFAETVQKFIGSFIEEPRVAFIKLCDRLHNTEDMFANSISDNEEVRQKALRKAYETRMIYGPIAKMLGMYELANILLDRAENALVGEEVFRHIEDEINKSTNIERLQKLLDKHKNLNHIKRKPFPNEVIRRYRNRTGNEQVITSDLSPQDMAAVVDIWFVDGFLNLLDEFLSRNPNLNPEDVDGQINNEYIIKEFYTLWFAERNTLSAVFCEYSSDTAPSLTEQMLVLKKKHAYDEPISLTMHEGEHAYEIVVYTHREFFLQHAPFIAGICKNAEMSMRGLVQVKLKRISDIYTSYVQNSQNGLEFLEKLGFRLHADRSIFVKINGREQQIYVPQNETVLSFLLSYVKPEEFARLQSIELDDETYEFDNRRLTERMYERVTQYKSLSLTFHNKFRIQPEWFDVSRIPFSTLQQIGKSLEERYNSITDIAQKKDYEEKLNRFAKDILDYYAGKKSGEFVLTKLHLELPLNLEITDLYKHIAFGKVEEEILIEVARKRLEYWSRLVKISIVCNDESGIEQKVIEAVNANGPSNYPASEKVFGENTVTFNFYIEGNNTDTNNFSDTVLAIAQSLKKLRKGEVYIVRNS